jgi:polysaccharide pyruvyl transferase WcaK-like protein
MKIDIVGWYGRRNVGDEAFYDVMRQFLCGHELTFCSPPQRPSEGDIVILGGGAVVSPYYLETLPPDKPKYALGVGLEYESEIELLEKANFGHVMLRNMVDADTAKARLKCPVTAIPDLAFNYQYNPGRRYVTEPKSIGIFLTDYVNPAIDRPPDQFGARAYSFHQNMAKVCDALAEKGYSLYFIPCCTWGYADDRRVAMDVVSHMKYIRKAQVRFVAYSPQAMIDTMTDFELTICMRFHAHIFSMIAGVPFVSIGTTRKVKLLLDEYELQETKGAWFEGDVFQACDLENTVERTLRNAENYSSRFKAISSFNYSALQGAKRTVRQSWLGESS